MGKQGQQERKPLKRRENKSKSLSKSMVMNYKTSSIWMKLGYSMGQYTPLSHMLPLAN